MKSAIQWFEELKVPFDGDITIQDIIRIQDESFNEGWKQGIRDALDMSSKGLVMEIVLDSINKKGLWEKPIANSK